MLPLMVSGGGGGSSITLNPTNNVLPKRLSATSFADSSITDNGTLVSFTEQITVAGSQPQATLGANGGTGGQLGLAGATSGTATISAPAVAGTSTNPFSFSNVLSVPVGSAAAAGYGFAGGAGYGMWFNSVGANLNFTVNGSTLGTMYANAPVGLGIGNAKAFGWSSNADPNAAGMDTLLSRKAAAVVFVGSSTVGNRAGYILGQNSAFVAADFTTAGNTSLQAITGLTLNIPASAINYNFHVHLAYSIATAAVVVAFGIQAATNAPTNIFATGRQQITVGPPATFAAGVLATLATTTATVVVSGTPGAIGTLYMVDIYGTIENPASANAINICVSTATAADVVTVKRGSYISFNV